MKKTITLLALCLIGTLSFAQQAPAIQWQKCLGGTGSDYAQSILPTPDGGYIVAGYTNSNNGDITVNHGSRDAWVVKLGPELSTTGFVKEAVVVYPNQNNAHGAKQPPNAFRENNHHRPYGQNGLNPNRPIFASQCCHISQRLVHFNRLLWRGAMGEQVCERINDCRLKINDF
jgi:hypothetical protein